MCGWLLVCVCVCVPLLSCLLFPDEVDDVFRGVCVWVVGVCVCVCVWWCGVGGVWWTVRVCVVGVCVCVFILYVSFCVCVCVCVPLLSWLDLTTHCDALRAVIRVAG